MHRIAAMIGLALLLAAPAHGLTLLTDDRFIGTTINGSVQCCVEPDFFAPFDASVPGAFQQSSISVSPDGLGFDGSAEGTVSGGITPEPEFNLIVGQGAFSIGFGIDRPGSLELDGELFAIGVAEQHTTLRVLAGSQVLFERVATGGVFFDFTTSLPAGVYTIEAVPFVSGFDAAAAFNFDFHLREIPEPAAGLLLGLGLAALGAFPCQSSIGTGRRT